MAGHSLMDSRMRNQGPDAFKCARSILPALGLCALILGFAPPARSAEIAASPDRTMADYQEIGARQRSIIADMKGNLAQKRAFETEYAELDTASGTYADEVAEATAFCRGTFSEEEYRRRTAICEAKQAELEARHNIVEGRRAELDAFDAARQAGAKALKASYTALAKSAKTIEAAMAGNQILGPIATGCAGEKKATKRRRCIEEGWNASSEVVAAAELEAFTTKNDAWRKRQADLVRKSVAQDEWRKEILASLETLRIPNDKSQPKDLADLKPGDVILLAPSLSFDISHVIPPAEWVYRVATSLASGESLRDAIPPPGETVSHTAAAVKSVNGQMLFLDHTLEGSRILTRATFEKKYGKRGIYVARPVLPVDGDKLWQAARKEALREKSDYGIRGENVVCSERIGIVVAQAIGKSLKARQIGPIDVTPADFFDTKRTGKYFVVSGLEKE